MAANKTMESPTEIEGMSSSGLVSTDSFSPYYEDAGITLYHGDCVEIMRAMKGVSIDAVITDPPYCSGGALEAQKNSGVQGHRAARLKSGEVEWFAADNMTTGGLIWLVRSVLVESRRVMKPNRSAFVFTDWRMVPHLAPALESSGLRYRNMIVWDKMSAGLGMGFKPAHEIHSRIHQRINRIRHQKRAERDPVSPGFEHKKRSCLPEAARSARATNRRKHA